MLRGHSEGMWKLHQFSRYGLTRIIIGRVQTGIYNIRRMKSRGLIVIGYIVVSDV